MNLYQLESFGGVAAEDDAVLEYFLNTDATSSIASGKTLMVLGRKGTGKTALVRYLTENRETSRALNLRSYPWNVHAKRIDRGASNIEAYVSSWRYFLAVQLASLALSQKNAWDSFEAKPLSAFLNQNYGAENPAISDVLRPPKLNLKKISFAPSYLGVTLLSVDLDRAGGDLHFGAELQTLSNAITKSALKCLADAKSEPVSLHFDELDHGISTFDEERRVMLIGLILAARELRIASQNAKSPVYPVIYLRSDLWDELQFSDKNKIDQSISYRLEWTSDSLMELIQLRLRAKLGADSSWNSISTSDLMRGSQTKWSHILARTFLRPRDVISFLNQALFVARRRDAFVTQFINDDIAKSRSAYSAYLKQELDDEIVPHWPRWFDALQACSAIGTLSFQRREFDLEYNQRNTKPSADEALAQLYRFSVIGYRGGIGSGGSSWIFQYTDPSSGWDSVASQLKVHVGLKEFAKLREKRSSADPYEHIDWDDLIDETENES